ncbi:MAG TPA: beta-L-arabinofuranosidase domain-containing protein, partial [Chitinophagaceae bacterium]|nr:beta-L-arabinofuranosidase domain-containing protein [Chitinophagaceae bacterium]
LDKRYLDFAELIVKRVEAREGLRMINAMLNNRDLEMVADGKAYQIIWNLLGLAKLYELTGNKDYIKAIENAWKNIVDHHLTITGGPWGGVGKHKECFNAKNYWSPYGFVETCSTMSWIQLNKMLLQLTGHPKYAQEIERSAYNALIGAQFANGNDWSYHVFSNGKKHLANYNDCCPSSGVLALQELAPMIYSQRGKGIALNLFSASEATLSVDNNAVRISQQTNFPFEGKVLVSVSPAKKMSFPVYIRIPEWATGAKISVDGKSLDVQPEPGAYMTINREWARDSRVEINFPIELKLAQKAEHAVIPQGTDDIYRVNWFALTRGPLVYASNGLIDGTDRERNFNLSGKDATQLFQPVSKVSGASGPAYELKLPVEKPLVFLPYYEAGGRDNTGWRLTWLQQKID